MEKKLESNNGLKIMLIVFIILTLALGGYLVYDKVLNKEENSKCIKESCNCNNQTSDDKKENSLPEWATYVLNQNITKMGYGSSDENGNYFWKDITMEQLNGYLKKLTTEYSLIKMHDYDGGCDFYCGLEIKYNDVDLTIYAGSIFFKNDSKLLSLLENDDYIVYNGESNYDTWHFGYARNIRNNGFDAYEIIDYIDGK